MVGRVLQVLYREIRGLHEAAYILALFALGSQLLALVRDRLIAHQFGADITLDIYYAAFRIPDLFFVVFASVLSVYVLIPFVADRLLESTESARQLVSTVFTWFLVAFAFAATAVIIAAEPIATIFFPGFVAEEHALLADVMRILLVQSLFLSISSLFGVATQLHRKFVLYAVSPLLYNIGIIAGIVLFYPLWGLRGMALGVVFGALLHALVQVPFVMHSGLFPRILTKVDVGLIGQVLRTSLPRAFTLMLHQFVLLALTGLATLMATGSVAVLQFAYNLQSVPLAIIGVSYSVAAFPSLARLFSNGDRIEYLGHVYTALRHIIFWSIPAFALIIVIRAQLVRVILGTGAFNWDDTRLVAAALALFALSLAAQAVHLLVVRAFYAGGDTRTPLVVTLVSSVGTIVLSATLFVLYARMPGFADGLASFFRVSDVVGTEVLVLPLAFSAMIILHSIVLTALFVRRYGSDAVKSGIGGVLLRSLGAAATAAAAAYSALNLLVDGFRIDTFTGIFMQGFIAGIIGIAAGVLFLASAESPELREVSSSLRRRFWRSRPIAPQET